MIPLSPNSGLIGWVPHCDTIHSLIRDYREKKKIMLNIEHRLMLQVWGTCKRGGGGWDKVRMDLARVLRVRMMVDKVRVMIDMMVRVMVGVMVGVLVMVMIDMMVRVMVGG